MPGVHDFTKFLKRGYGRGTDFSAQDRRAGIMTRKEQNEIVREYDAKEPDVLDYYLEITGYSKEEFYSIMDEQREKVGRLSKEEIVAALEDYKKRHASSEGSKRSIKPERVETVEALNLSTKLTKGSK